ncbi:MAG TPA: glutamine-hydrolyzing GMP synthase subunit GuaA [Euryarchaeota archaeon]|nr:glutamine-hydrolyzing GMP synthase subunit GuaA [Euryarchaeota archaeon]
MFDPETFISEADRHLDIIDGKTIIACSGGVDSTAAAVLASRRLGDDLLAVFIDTGFMRKDEPEEVDALLTRMGVNHMIVDSSSIFYSRLESVCEPEAKRKIIGNVFIEEFERIANKWGAKFLIQGTIAPDWIESGGELRDVIKSHHNVGGLPEKFGLVLVEPLRDLYKDEVRQLARYLGCEVAERQPFPGPGLAIRIMGEATKESADIVREACHIVETELEKAASQNEMELPWQYFAVLLPVKTVGVHGDVRAYGYTVAVRAVQSIDGMTAAYSKIPHDVLERISIRITNTMGSRVNRVVYDVTNKPPGTIEWE